MTTEAPTVYRWSPHPIGHYVNATSANSWLARLSPEEWNLAWLALPDPEYKSAPDGFESALTHSLSCSAIIERLHGEQLVLPMKRLMHGEAVGTVHLLKHARWNETPRLMMIDLNWFERWLERAMLARANHPNMLNRMIDDQAVHLEAARIIITKYGWATSFQEGSD